MSIYNWGFNNFYINSFMPTPYWGGCGCNAFNSGFQFGIFNSIFNYNTPQMNIFPFMPQFSMPLFNPYNNIFAMTNNYIMPTFSPALYNFSIPALFSQLNTFNNYTEKLIEYGKNNKFNLLIKNKKTNKSLKNNIKSNSTRNETIKSSNTNASTNANANTNIKTNPINIEIDQNFQNTGKLDANFLNKVKEVAKNLNCDYKDLLALMNSESSLNAQAWNGTTAVGLIQFTDKSIEELNRVHGLNLSKEKIAKMSPIEQLDLAEKYLMIAKSYNFAPNARLSAGDLYAITFLPGRANQEVLCRQGENYYKQNKGLDLNNDGVISKQDLEKRLAKKHINESIFV